jgi:hypothetical protein
MDLAREQLNAHIQSWYTNKPSHPHTLLHHQSLKDPAKPHPDERTTTQATSSNNSALPTSPRLEGYFVPTDTSPAPMNPPLRSIFKNSTQPVSQRRSPSLPPIQHHYQFQPIIQPANYNAAPRLDNPAPRQRDSIGSPWCDCCTAQLSDNDTTAGLRDPSLCRTRYRLRQDNDQPPTHSNQHSDFLRKFRVNAKYHDVQARTGILPDFQATSTFTITPDVSNLATTMGSLQYSRYRARGGR